jgi:tyrosyl-tRNA synthetase
MSKSTGNYIGISEAPEAQYGKVMSIPDTALRNYAELVTRWTSEEITVLFAALEAGTLHPRDAKMRLAREVVELFHGAEAALSAEEHFRAVFQERELPPEMPEYALTGATHIVELLLATGLAESKSAARRLIQQKGVRLDGQLVEDVEAMVEPRVAVLQVGRRRYLRLRG